MCAPILDRVMCRGKRLAQYLAAEYLCAADIAALAAEEVILDTLEFEELDQIAEDRMHL